MIDIDPWKSACTLFMKDLSTDEQRLFETSTLDNLLETAVAAQKEHEENSHSRHISKKLEPFISAIDQYGRALDVYSNTYSIAMAPLWGSVRVLLHIAQSFEKYFQKLIDMLERIGDVLPRCQAYQNLFPANRKLLQIISIAYVDVIHFCWTAKKAFRKMKKSTTIPLILKLCWKDLNKEFEEKTSVFRNHVKRVEKEAGISGMIETHQGWALMEYERKLNRRHQILSSLSEIKYVSKLQSERKKHHRGTGSWLLETPEFKKWKTGAGSDCLWCYGIPGSGKTVLMSSTIHALAGDIFGTDITAPVTPIHDIVSGKITRLEFAVIYHYCEFSDSRSLEPVVILGTLIRQLLETIVIPESLEKQIERCFSSRVRQATLDELSRLFEDAMAQFSKIYVLVDGIDECKNEDVISLLKIFGRLLQQKTHTSIIKIIHFSRHNDVISGFLNLHSRLELSTAKISHDINIFIEETVRSKISLGELEVFDASLEKEVVTRLKDGAHGMFLWVYFQLLDLCDAVTEFEVSEILGRLPEGIIETYARILKKIAGNPSNKALAQQTFKWTVCAKRPMLLSELAEAVAFKATDICWSREKIPNPGRLYKACGNLVVIDEEDKMVRLAHHTVQQFLLESLQPQALEFFQISPARADIELGEICVAYLSFSDFETQIALSNHKSLPLSRFPKPMNIVEHVTSQPDSSIISSSMSQVISRFRSDKRSLGSTDFDLSKFLTVKTPPSRTLQERYLLLDYVVQTWLDHTLSFSESNTSMWKAFRNLALKKILPFDIRPWGDINELGKRPFFLKTAEEFIHEAVLGGDFLTNGVLLAAKRRKPEAIGEYGQKTLQTAAARGQTLIVELLVARGVNVDAKDRTYGRTALHLAASEGHTATVERLIAKGANVGMQDSSKMTAMDWATHKGHTAIAELLRINGAPSFVENEFQNPVLHLAARAGHLAKVELLIVEGAIINAKDKDGSTALHEAAANGHATIAELLLLKGANVMACDPDGKTALDFAATAGHVRTVELLITHGAHIDAKSRYGRTALHKAAKYGHSSTMKLLIANGAKIEAVDIRGRTALHLAVRCDHLKIVQLLIDDGASIDAMDNMGMTALHHAVHDGYVKMVELLIEHGAKIEKMDIQGRTALHLAVRCDHSKMVQLLIDNGASIDAVDNMGMTALHHAVQDGYVTMVELLIESGANIGLMTNMRVTALHLAVRCDHSKMVQSLIDNGAIIDAVDNMGMTALHHAVQDGYVKMVELLICSGANIGSTTNREWTALHFAACHGSVRIAQLLIANGANFGSLDEDGRTPLNWALSKKHTAIIDLLKLAEQKSRRRTNLIRPAHNNRHTQQPHNK